MTTDSTDFATQLHAAHVSTRDTFVLARAPMDACHADASATPHAKYAAFWTFRTQTAQARAYLRREAARLKRDKHTDGAP